MAAAVFLHVWFRVTSMMVVLAGVGILFPTTTTAALLPHAAFAGIAGAFLGGVQNLGAGLAGGLIARLHDNSPVPLALVLLGLSIACVVVYALILFREAKT